MRVVPLSALHIRVGHFDSFMDSFERFGADRRCSIVVVSLNNEGVERWLAGAPLGNAPLISSPHLGNRATQYRRGNVDCFFENKSLKKRCDRSNGTSDKRKEDDTVMAAPPKLQLTENLHAAVWRICEHCGAKPAGTCGRIQTRLEVARSHPMDNDFYGLYRNL